MKNIPKVSIQIRVSPEVLDAIDQEAAAEDRSRSWIINKHLSDRVLGNRPRQPEKEASQRNC